MKAVILISGHGSNLQSIINNTDRINLQICCVISNNKNAFGLKRAASSKIQTSIIDPELFNSKEAFDRELISIIDLYGAELIILAGYMRILTPFLFHIILVKFSIFTHLYFQSFQDSILIKKPLIPLKKIMD